MFDFLKKKEFAEIASLITQLNEAKEMESSLKSQLDNANSRIGALEKYEAIINVQNEVERILSECSDKEAAIEQKIDKLQVKYKDGYAIYSALYKQIRMFNESVELSEYGVYQPHFKFEASESYKEAILGVREAQKIMVKAKLAVVGGDNITWNGSIRAGRAMVNREKKLMLRAFNGECDSFTASADWSNIQRMEERIDKSFEQINKVYEEQSISISLQYKNLKVNELRLTYEYQLKKHEEKEEQRALRELAREEEKVQRDVEAAKIKAEKEEILYNKAIEKVRKELGFVSPEKQQELQNQIAELEEKLRLVESERQRALSMAQQTRRGYVYIISNIGSFGEGIYKIGMTRRLDPMDRIRELGDASVPFQFDVHAIIFCEDAPALESALHKTFDHKRLNRINMRREFFSCDLIEIENAVEQHHGKIECIRIPEAQQYRESLVMRENNSLDRTHKSEEEMFSSTLFV